MGWPVYSERFLTVVGYAQLTFTVPVGQRAVVTCITAVNWAAAARSAQVLAGGATIWHASVQASVGNEVRTVRVPVYGGETIVAATDGADIYLTVSGYLFDDPTGRRSPPASASTLPDSGAGLPGPPSELE